LASSFGRAELETALDDVPDFLFLPSPAPTAGDEPFLLLGAFASGPGLDRAALADLGRELRAFDTGSEWRMKSYQRATLTPTAPGFASSDLNSFDARENRKESHDNEKMNNSSGIQGKDLSLLNYSHEDSKLYNDL
jgi:hypothetical protein